MSDEVRLIDAEKLGKAFELLCEDERINMTAITYFALRELLDTMPTVEVKQDNGWISVKDRMLENQNDVLVCDVRGNVFAAYYFPFLYEWRYAFTVEPCKYEITHWMPLPTPPKSEDTE